MRLVCAELKEEIDQMKNTAAKPNYPSFNLKRCLLRTQNDPTLLNEKQNRIL